MAPEVRELLEWGTYQGFIRGTRCEWGFIHGTRSEGAVGVSICISMYYTSIFILELCHYDAFIYPVLCQPVVQLSTNEQMDIYVKVILGLCFPKRNAFLL